MTSSRRSFLQKVAATGVASVVGFAILPSPPDSVTIAQSAPDEGNRSSVADNTTDLESDRWNAREDLFDYVTERSITDEDATPIARYQYEATYGSFEPTAPINVVFPLTNVPKGRRLSSIMAVLADAGWTQRLEEYTRYAWDREAAEYVLQEATAAETYFGTSGRLHVRSWEFEGIVSLQAHEDAAARPKHLIDSYERGRRAMESLFADAGWTVVGTRIDLANEKGPDHDGYATVIRPGTAL